MNGSVLNGSLTQPSSLNRTKTDLQSEDTVKTVEALLTNLTVEEKLAAMDVLWRELSSNTSELPSPAWHRNVLADRLAHPADGSRMSLIEARKDIEEWRN